jgi:RNA polymerase sigma factor (sigma-70 family)
VYQNDSEIISGIKNDEDEAFAALMRRYYQPLYRYGQHFTKDETIITDCIQDVFVNIWQNRHNNETIVYVRQYLLIALKRRIIRVTSQNNKIIDMPGEGLRQYNFSMEFSIEDLIVEKQLAQETAEKLRQIINQLPARQKEVIYLVYYQQLDHEQVAAVMNISRQSVYNLLHESLKKIRVFWKSAAFLVIALLRV